MKSFRELVDEAMDSQMTMGHGFVKDGEKRKDERRMKNERMKKDMRKENRRKGSY